MRDKEQVAELHAVYRSMTGMDVQLRFNREASWVYWVQAGFRQEDLVAVLKRLLAMVRNGDRRPECLKFSNVIEQLDRFEEELAMIKAEKAKFIPDEQPLSVFEMQKVMEAKQAALTALINEHGHEDAFGLMWDDDKARQKCCTLRKAIRDLRQRIADKA